MEHSNDAKKHSSGVGVALLTGLAAGVAAGIFIRSDKGQKMTKEAKRQGGILQKKLSQKLRNIKELTSDKYEEIVDDLVAGYVTTKTLTKSELGKLKEYLMGQWDEIKEQLEERRQQEDSNEEDEGEDEYAESMEGENGEGDQDDEDDEARRM